VLDQDVQALRCGARLCPRSDGTTITAHPGWGPADTSLRCAGCLPGSRCSFGLLLLSSGQENSVLQQSSPVLCCEFSHSGTETSPAQTQAGSPGSHRQPSHPDHPSWSRSQRSAPGKRVPFSQKGGRKVETSRVHMPVRSEACVLDPHPRGWRLCPSAVTPPARGAMGRVRGERRHSSPGTSTAAMPLLLSGLARMPHLRAGRTSTNLSTLRVDRLLAHLGKDSLIFGTTVRAAQHTASPASATAPRSAAAGEAVRRGAGYVLAFSNRRAPGCPGRVKRETPACVVAGAAASFVTSPCHSAAARGAIPCPR